MRIDVNPEKKPIAKEIIISVIFGIVLLESIALLKGIDGTLFSLVLVILAGLGGLILPQPKVTK